VLKEKKILVAGAGGLLGSKLVIALLAEGALVIATDINIENLHNRFENENGYADNNRLTFGELDVTDEASVKDYFNALSGLSGAVNATYPRNKAYGQHFFDVTLDSFNENMALHLGSAFLFTQACAKYFKCNKEPFSLINISSIYGVIAPKFEVYGDTAMTMPIEYAAIKSAILHLGKYVSSYVGDSRFRINSVSPGGILNNQPSEFLDKYKSNTHGEGMLDVGDILGSIIFLLSDSSKFVVGQNIIVDDGYSL